MTAIPMAGFPGEVSAIVQRSRLVTRLHYRPSVGSTNEVALELARAGAPHGTLVLADGQDSGRGRHGRSWHSPPGQGLWLSLILRPSLPLDRGYLVTWAGAAALAETAAFTAGVPARIKWPNDVLVRDRKIAGLLAEAGSRGDVLDFLVLGAGLNVNQEESDFPADLRDVAASLRMSGGHALDRAAVFGIFLGAFESRYDRLLRDDGEAIRREWIARSCVIGNEIEVFQGEERFTARATGVANDGALLVERNGTPFAVHSADVDLIRVKE